MKQLYMLYGKNGDVYLGKREFSSVYQAIKYMKERFPSAKWAYTGRYNYGGQSHKVLVVTDKQWTEAEKQKRRKNGLLYINEHYIKE